MSEPVYKEDYEQVTYFHCANCHTPHDYREEAEECCTIECPNCGTRVHPEVSAMIVPDVVVPAPTRKQRRRTRAR